MRPSTCAVLLCAVCLAPPSALADDILGVTWGTQIVSMDSVTGAATLLGQPPLGVSNALAVDSTGRVLMSSGGLIVELDTETLATTTVVDPPTLDIRGMDFDPGDVLYAIVDGGMSPSADPDELWTIDLVTGAATLVGATDHAHLQSLAVSSTGVLYSYNEITNGSELVIIDPGTGASTAVAADPDGSHAVQWLDFDACDRLFGGRHALFEIDVASGVFTPVGPPHFHDVRGAGFLKLPSLHDIGDGLAGVQGEPLLAATGQLVAGAEVTLSLTNAAAGAPTTLVVGFSKAGLPLFGGTLVPAPDIVTPTFTTDAQGRLDLVFRWPAGVPCGFKTWCQFWIEDAAGPQGWSASNALVMTVGP